jgi:hypothetical protein
MSMLDDRNGNWWAPLTGIFLGAMVSMTTVEFVEVQKLSPDDLRTRFSLPSSCDPTVTALTTDSSVKLVTVAIECRAKPGGTPPPAEPTDRQQPSRPRKGY